MPRRSTKSLPPLASTTTDRTPAALKAPTPSTVMRPLAWVRRMTSATSVPETRRTLPLRAAVVGTHRSSRASSWGFTDGERWTFMANSLRWRGGGFARRVTGTVTEPAWANLSYHRRGGIAETPQDRTGNRARRPSRDARIVAAVGAEEVWFVVAPLRRTVGEVGPDRIATARL